MLGLYQGLWSHFQLQKNEDISLPRGTMGHFPFEAKFWEAIANTCGVNKTVKLVNGWSEESLFEMV
jgi:hypothetical protein